MPSYAKTTGSHGIHVYVPIVRGPTQKQVWTFAKELAQTARDAPAELITAEYRIAKRPPGRVLVDYNQNAWGRTLASVYSPRPKPLATVSMPVTWKEIENGVDDRATSRIDNVPARIAKLGDLWKPLADPQGRFDLAPLLAAAPNGNPTTMTLPLATDYPPMEAKLVDAIPRRAAVAVRAEVGRLSLPRVPRRRRRRAAVEGGPAARALLSGGRRGGAVAAGEAFVLDGEIVVPEGGTLSFDDLLQRIHPAESRVAEARAASIRRIYIVFDLLVDDAATRSSSSRSPSAAPRSKRSPRRTSPGVAAFRLSPATPTRAARSELVRVGRRGARRRHRQAARPARIAPAIATGMQKIKQHAHRRVRRRRISLRLERRDVVGSLLLGLYDDDGLLHHVGFTLERSPRERSNRR